MPVADLPQTTAAVTAGETTDVIEVIGAHSDEALKIDRRTYQVRETQHSAQKSAAQLLRGLPAVTITPDDRLLILGAGISKLYVDGRPYLGDPSIYLRTVHGSDIERIEVITNPSAQFSSEGTGGIINLVLRKNSSEGLTGNASLEQSTYGYGLVDTTLNLKRNDWTYQIKAGGNIGTMARQRYSERRSVRISQNADPTINSENGLFAYYGTVGRLSGQATYKLDSKTSLSAQIGGGGGHDIVTDNVDYLAVTPNFRPFSEKRRVDSLASYVTGEVNLDHRGSKQGETLNATLQFYTNPDVYDVTNAYFSDGRAYRIELRKPSDSLDGQTEWKHPMGRGQILSLGSSWHVDQTSQRYRFVSNDSDGLFGPDNDDAYDGRNRTVSAYASFQQTLGDLTLAPGIRGEANKREISTPGSDDIHINRTDIFPSFHTSYKISKALQISASYSKRIDRAKLDYLRPYRLVEDAYTRVEGNPRLKDQDTNAYEMSVQFRPGKIEANATIYARQTRNLWNRSYAVDASGASVYSYVNAGTMWNSGAQFDLSVPLTTQLKTHTSVNLFDQRSPVDTIEGRVSQRIFRYSTNGTLEWTGKDRDGVPGDVAQLQWSFNSPSQAYQIREASWFDMSAAFTHSFDRSLSLSATFRYAGRTRQSLNAPLVEEISSRQRTPEFQLKLQKTL
jgi:outer membrane cobalamin receptor